MKNYRTNLPILNPEARVDDPKSQKLVYGLVSDILLDWAFQPESKGPNDQPRVSKKTALIRHDLQVVLAKMKEGDEFEMMLDGSQIKMLADLWNDVDEWPNGQGVADFVEIDREINALAESLKPQAEDEDG